MAHRSSAGRWFPVFVSFVLLGVASGCGSQVTTGDDGQGGSDNQSDGGDGGTCTTYLGDGCTPGATQMCEDGFGPGENPTMSCELVPGKACTTQWQAQDCDTPLVLSFDGAPVEYTSGGSDGFDINGSRSQLLDWPTARTPWLALDRDGSGSIDDGSELFGSMTQLRSGGRAKNGFAALRELDTNGDGRITADDAGFAKLALWYSGASSGAGGDRLAALESRGIVSIDLGYTSDARCDAHGNCEIERASFVWLDAAGATHTGAVVDVHLAPQGL